jgi:branched-chain amino acid transport system substrate-binding protein
MSLPGDEFPARIKRTAMRRLRALSTSALVVAMLLAGLAGTPASAQPEPVSIYAILPLTGQLAFLGQQSQKSMQGVEQATNAKGGIAGRPLKFVFLDDGSNPVTAVQLANSMPKTAPVFFDGGPLATCKATASVATNGPVLYCLSPAFAPAKGSYGFSSSISVADCFDATYRYFVSQGWTRIAIINSTDASGQAGEGIIAALNQKYNMNMVAHERFAPGDISVSAQVSRMLAANPQVILVGANGNPFSTVLRGLNDAGNTIPVATTNGNMITALLAADKPFLPKTFLLAAPRWAAPETVRSGPIKAAVQQYVAMLAQLGLTPDMGNSLAYDPALIVVAAIRQLGPTATAAQVRDYIANLHGFAGSDGFYDFRVNSERGLTVRDSVVVRYNAAHGTWTGVSGPGGYPLPTP